MKQRQNTSRPAASISRLWWLLSVLLLVSLACSVPSFGRTAPTAAPVPPSPTPMTEGQPQAVAPLPTATAVAVGQEAEPAAATFPPALVETDPVSSSQLALGDRPVLYFNQPMERASVEGALQVDPAVPGRLEWLDDSTARFIPQQPLPPDSDFHLTISTDARSAQGQNLAEPVQVSYQSASSLRLGEQLPAPNAEEVNPSSAVVVTFNAPVVALGDEPENGPAAFTLEPQAQGRGEWLNTSTYIFYPEPALLGGAQYTVRLNPDLKSLDGSPLAAEVPNTWSFATASPVLLSVQPGPEQPVELDKSFQLTFNQPMDPASVEADFSLQVLNGEKVPGAFQWNETHTEVTFKPERLLERGTGYTLILFGTAKSQGGAEIGSDYVAGLVSVPQFGVAQTRPTTGEALSTYDGYGVAVLTFGSPVASGQDLNGLVKINPPLVDLNVTRSIEGYKVFIAGHFQPSTSYSLSVSPDLTDKWGAKLGAPFNYTFSSQQARPSLVIPVRQIGAPALYVPYGENNLQAYSTNITRLAMSRGSLSLAEFTEALQDWQGLRNWEGRVEASWARLLYPTLNKSAEIPIPLTQAGDLLAPGLYFLHVETQPAISEGPVPPHLMVVSPVQITFKVSARQAFVWAVRVSDYSPLVERQVTIYDNNARAVATCTTDSQGVCQAELPSFEDDFPVLYAVTGQPGEVDFSFTGANWSQGILPWEFGIPYQNKGSQPEVYLYTDRPIYRPGQAVHFRAIVRGQENGRYSTPDFSEMTLDVVSPYDPLTSQSQILSTLRLPLSPYGAVTGVYTLPEDATPGTYTIRSADFQFEELYFQVAEYRKPEVDLSIRFDKEDQLLGQDIRASIDARYFFGAPAGNLSVQWSLFRTVESPMLLSGMSIGRLDMAWLNPSAPFTRQEVYLMDGQGQTDPDGRLVVALDGEELRERFRSDTGSMYGLTLEVTVEDESGLPVSTRAQTRLHSTPSYIGLRPEQWSVSAGDGMTFLVRAVDWKGNPITAQSMSARFRKVVFVQNSPDDPYGPAGFRPEYTESGSTDFFTSDTGEARLAFTPSEPGTFMLEVTGADGAVSQQMVWVGGPGSAPWPALPNQHLTLQGDQETYRAGDNARILIPNPFSSGAVALVTVERGEVMRSFVFPIEDASYEFELPLGEEDAPNVYVSVSLLGRTSGQPDFRQGYLELTVDPAAQLLDVELLSSPQQAQPGEQVAFQLRVTNAAGQPVQGEFSLALVDKAVLALADPNSPSILQAFYGRQPLGVQTAVSLAHYAGRFVHITEGRGGGGGGGDADLPQPIRSEFEDTAYWNGTIETDENGIAQVVINLPDNLTTWQADVRGVSVDTEVGQARVDLVTSKPLLVRPVTPRFVVFGDHLELAAVVHNNTQETLRTSVRLEAPGFTLDDPDQAVQPVEVPAGERQRISWWGTVQDVPTLDLTFSVESDDLEDAAGPEGGPLPVLRYSMPQTYGTAGVISGPGEKLEWVNVPRTFTPSGGALTVEIMPSLSSVVLNGVAAQEDFPRDFTEPVLSRLLSNLATYSALRDLKHENDTLRSSLQGAVSRSVDRLVRLQNEDGGWGWSAGYASDAYLSSYVLLGLVYTSHTQSIFVDPLVLQKGQDYLAGTLFVPTTTAEGWLLDRLAFQTYALQQSGRADLALSPLYELRDKLSPWGKAFLALALDGQSVGDERASTLISDLQASASRSATGAHWQDTGSAWQNWSSTAFTTAVTAYAIAQMDPDSPVLVDAVRYLVLNRQASGGWASSYETTWVLLALIEYVQGTGDLQAAYAYGANLNGMPRIEGQVASVAQSINPVTAVVPLSDLRSNEPNLLQIQRGEGSGQLYYRAFLRVDRPVEEATALRRGLSLERRYYRSGQDCRKEDCQPVSEVDLADPQPLLVRLTLTAPEDMFNVVVEDFIPAGAEVLNPRLNTSQWNITPEEGQEETLPYELQNPFEEGWGWWFFNAPQIHDERVRWVVNYLPAGTYELTYRLTPLLPGEFHILPAHAWQYYFPEVEGSSAGDLLSIQ